MSSGRTKPAEMGPEKSGQGAVRIGLLVGEVVVAAVHRRPECGPNCSEPTPMMAQPCSTHSGHEKLAMRDQPVVSGDWFQHARKRKFRRAGAPPRSSGRTEERSANAATAWQMTNPHTASFLDLQRAVSFSARRWLEAARLSDRHMRRVGFRWPHAGGRGHANGGRFCRSGARTRLPRSSQDSRRLVHAREQLSPTIKPAQQDGASDLGRPMQGAAGARWSHAAACAEPSFQPVADLGDPGRGAGFVLLSAGCATDPDGADRLIADPDRQGALLGGGLGIEPRPDCRRPARRPAC